ncbi:MAG: Sua5/YciO/YrdC/YwlC family protein, partial [Flavobacteriaceae bacterium]|nr:Sua5/YciO/YrdC/YwlC family protein [Flavobacteriaceae bacterium]
MKALRIRLYEDNPNPKQVGQVVECLKQGGLVIYPTDTVYALGCDSQNAKALQQLAKLKGVSLEKAYFSFVCADLSDLSVYAKQLDLSLIHIS